MENKKAEISDEVDKILKKIREVRKTKGLTNENMANDLEISTAAYSKLEQNKTALTLNRLLKIKDILEISLSDLFELRATNIFNQDLKDSSIGNVQNLYQETNQKFIASLQEEINFLRDQINKQK